VCGDPSRVQWSLPYISRPGRRLLAGKPARRARFGPGGSPRGEAGVALHRWGNFLRVVSVRSIITAGGPWRLQTRRLRRYCGSQGGGGQVETGGG
jgi:hypothetical protein